MAEARPGVAKLYKFFGKRPGQGMTEFKKELDDLTNDDMKQLVTGIENESLTY